MFALVRDLCNIAKLFWHFKSLFWHGSRYFDNDSNAKPFVELLRQLGPFYLKLGQWLGQRPDLVPPAFCAELKTLQTDSPQHSWSDTCAQLGPGAALLDLFAFHDQTSGEPQAMSSGSIAQVYRVSISGARMKQFCAQYDNEQDISVKHLDDIDDEKEYACVLKVCHPGARKHFEDALETVFRIYSIVRWCSGSDSILQLVDIHDIADEMHQQCDLLIEAANARRMKDNFKHNKFVNIPDVYFARECLLLEEAVQGALFYDQIGDPRYDTFDYYGDADALANTRVLAKEITMAAFFQMMMVDGVVHGDCHSGNILYKLAVRDKAEYEDYRAHINDHVAEGYPVHVSPCTIEVWFLDFGITVAIDQEMRRAMLELTVSINANDPLLMVRAFERVLINSDDYPARQLQEFERDCVATSKRLQECDLIGSGSSFQTQVAVLLENFRKHKLTVDAAGLRVVIGWILIDENSPILGRNDNLPDNTIRWVNQEDLDDNFRLHHLSSIIYAARTNRHLIEKERAAGGENVPEFVAPDLDLYDRRTAERATQSLELFEMGEHDDDDKQRRPSNNDDDDVSIVRKSLKNRRRRKRIVVASVK